ncbi:hypothetical protein ANN_12208 [Periplaneta americana]|uniref:Uncharacterized protein n=1 Tax=Periplaneta americana TaxID=6978 RepID=A0ABQ8TFW9_PERAM|nr:hypothetical protein ANN_12208 [Periplaneta americana]
MPCPSQTSAFNVPNYVSEASSAGPFRGGLGLGEDWRACRQSSAVATADAPVSRVGSVVRERRLCVRCVRIPSRSTIHDLVNKVKRTGSFLNKKRVQQRRVLTEEKLDEVGAG